LWFVNYFQIAVCLFGEMLKIKVLCTNNLWHVRKIAPVVFIIPLKSAIAINIASAVDYHKFSAAILKTKAGLPNFRRHYRRALKF